MKPTDIHKVLASELGAAKNAEVPALNGLLKTNAEKAGIKFRITGKTLGQGHTAMVKAVTADGLKIVTVNKVILIRFADIDGIEKAKPRTDRPVPTKEYAAKKAAKKAAKFPNKNAKSKGEDDDDEDDDDDDFDDEDDIIESPKKETPEKSWKPRPRGGKGKGSSFIPGKG
jgi:phosphopantothenoylcysteine synthetase/decarboxylase